MAPICHSWISLEGDVLCSPMHKSLFCLLRADLNFAKDISATLLSHLTSTNHYTEEHGRHSAPLCLHGHDLSRLSAGVSCQARGSNVKVKCVNVCMGAWVCVCRHVLEFLNLCLPKTSKNVCVLYKVHFAVVNIIRRNSNSVYSCKSGWPGRHPVLPRSDLFDAAWISKVINFVLFIT